MSEYLLRAENLSFTVPIFKPSEQKLTINPSKILRGFYSGGTKREVKILINSVNFGITKGQRLGIIGKNGAGKTTLLRLITGVYKLNGGNLEVNGTVQGLFNTELGMNYDATGVENIYLRGLQMGLKISEIQSVVENVAEFADIGDSIHRIFGDYSTGMRMRLSVAISTMITPDILIMDEWIGAGDETFTKKLNKRISMLIDNSRALIIATHSAQLMSSLCTHGFVLDNGNGVFFGPINEALDYYRNNVLKVSV